MKRQNDSSIGFWFSWRSAVIAMLCASLLSLFGLSGDANPLTQTAPPALKLPDIFPEKGQGNPLTYDALVEARRLYQQGDEQYQTIDLQAALESFQQAVRLYREAGNHEGEAACRIMLGLTYLELREYSESIESFQRALTMFQGMSDPWSEAGEVIALNGLGSAYSSLGQYTQAIETYQQSLAIAQEIGNQISEASALGNLGLTYISVGQYTQAVGTLRQSLTIVQESGDHESEAAVLNHLGSAYSSLRQYTQAIESYQQSLAIAQEIGSQSGEVNSLTGLGAVFIILGRYSQAVEAYQQSLVIAQEIDDRSSKAAALFGLGATYMVSGQYTQVLRTYQQSLVIAQEIGGRLAKAPVLDYLGLAYLQSGQYLQAIETYQQSLAIWQEVGDRESEADTLKGLGYVLFSSGRFSEAEPFLLDSIEISESLRADLSDSNQVAFFNTQRDVYNSLQQVFIAQGKTNQALEIAERGRARAFVELLSQQLSLSPSEHRDLTAPAVVDSPDIGQIRQISKAQNATLVEYSVLYREYESQNGRRLRPSELLIWVVNPTGEVAFREVDLTAIEQAQPTEEIANAAEGRITALSALATRTRNAIGVTVGRSAYAEPDKKRLLQNSYQLLIEPIAELLPIAPEERVIFIPQGGLFLIPFPALVDENGTYLIEKHAILTAPSIQSLALTHQRRQQIRTTGLADEVLVVGNPTMPAIPTLPDEPPLHLSALPGAEQEALDIAQLFDTQALLGADATETTVVQRMSNARIVHLATHGFLDYGQPSQFGVRDIPGAVALAPSREDDGLLTASEILDLDLSAELVVLSACDTGRGEITGDGVIGLSRALIAAGTPSVIVSLWKVPDDSTAMLMTEFYQQLQQNPDKAQALRQAMLVTMTEHPSVRDWAAFTLIGEAE